MNIIKPKLTGENETKIHNSLFYDLNLSWGAIGTISTMLSYCKEQYTFKIIQSYSPTESSYKIKKYIAELVSKNVLIENGKNYMINDKYKTIT